MTGETRKDRLDLWQGDFGDNYMLRNLADEENICARGHWLLTALKKAKPWPESVFEIGCGSGANLKALRRISPSTARYGCEPNDRARGFAMHAAGMEIDNTPASALKIYPDDGLISS